MRRWGWDASQRKKIAYLDLFYYRSVSDIAQYPGGLHLHLKLVGSEFPAVVVAGFIVGCKPPSATFWTLAMPGELFWFREGSTDGLWS